MIYWLAAVAVLGAFAAGAALGAPYLPIWGHDGEDLLDLAGLKPGDKLLDLGSGDGKLLKAAAKRGIYGEGWEVNPILYAVSVVNCWPYRKLVRLHLGNYWNRPLPPADVVYVFLIERYMARLDRKLRAEIDRPTGVISYVFEIPGVKAVSSTKNAYYYRYPIHNRN